MKKIIILLIALFATQATYSQTRIRNLTPVTLKVKVNWDINNSKTLMINPDQIIDINEDGNLIKRSVQVWYNSDPDVLPYDDNGNVNPAWESGLQQVVNYTIPNGTLNQAIRIIGYIDPKNQRLTATVTSRPSLNLDREDV